MSNEVIDYSTDYPPPPEFDSPNCASTDPEIFFPKSAREVKRGDWPKESRFVPRPGEPKGKTLQATETAKTICKACDHIIPCRDYAIINSVQFGIWGATTYRERLLLSKLMGA